MARDIILPSLLRSMCLCESLRIPCSHPVPWIFGPAGLSSKTWQICHSIRGEYVEYCITPVTAAAATLTVTCFVLAHNFNRTGRIRSKCGSMSFSRTSGRRSRSLHAELESCVRSDTAHSKMGLRRGSICAWKSFGSLSRP